MFMYHKLSFPTYVVLKCVSGATLTGKWLGWTVWAQKYRTFVFQMHSLLQIRRIITERVGDRVVIRCSGCLGCELWVWSAHGRVVSGWNEQPQKWRHNNNRDGGKCSNKSRWVFVIWAQPQFQPAVLLVTPEPLNSFQTKTACQLWSV